MVNPDDESEMADYRAEKANREYWRRCGCPGEMPGTCPGRTNCPMWQEEEECE